MHMQIATVPYVEEAPSAVGAVLAPAQSRPMAAHPLALRQSSGASPKGKLVTSQLSGVMQGRMQAHLRQQQPPVKVCSAPRFHG